MGDVKIGGNSTVGTTNRTTTTGPVKTKGLLSDGLGKAAQAQMGSASTNTTRDGLSLPTSDLVDDKEAAADAAVAISSNTDKGPDGQVVLDLSPERLTQLLFSNAGLGSQQDVDSSEASISANFRSIGFDDSDAAHKLVEEAREAARRLEQANDPTLLQDRQKLADDMSDLLQNHLKPGAAQSAAQIMQGSDPGVPPDDNFAATLLAACAATAGGMDKLKRALFNVKNIVMSADQSQLTLPAGAAFQRAQALVTGVAQPGSTPGTNSTTTTPPTGNGPIGPGGSGVHE